MKIITRDKRMNRLKKRTSLTTQKNNETRHGWMVVFRLKDEPSLNFATAITRSKDSLRIQKDTERNNKLTL